MQAASWKHEQKSNSSTPYVVYRVISRFRNTTRYIIGRQRCWKSRKPRWLQLASLQSRIRCSDYQVSKTMSFRRCGHSHAVASGWHKHSLAYVSTGHRRYNQPFNGTVYGPTYIQGDVIGVGYRPRTGTIFFTRNGKKLDDVAHGVKTLNLFPTVGANGPCTVHVNFGQSGFVFIEANVKKWGLAPAAGSLAPPPAYGNEQGSILLEGGRANNSQTPQYTFGDFQYNRPRFQGRVHGHGRSQSTPSGGAERSNIGQPGRTPYSPTSPGPVRSPTEISLAPINVTPTGRSSSPLGPPPEYSSPEGSRRNSEESGDERQPLLQNRGPTPAYEHVVGIINQQNANGTVPGDGYGMSDGRMV